MPKASFIVARFSFMVLAASTLGVAMLAAPAVGQTTCSSTTKCFFAVNPVSPSNPTAGASNTFTFTIQNKAMPQQLGAVQISAPTGFMITGASLASGAPGEASSTSSSAVFTDLSVAPGSTVTLTVTATVSCGSGSYQWPIAAKQSNNFNGSGNNFQLDPQSVPNLSGTATGSCTQSPPCPSRTTCSASASSSTTGDSITVTTSTPVPQGDVVVAGIEGTGSGVSYTCQTYTSSPDVFSFAVYNASGVPQPMITLTVTVRIDKSVVGSSGHPGASSWQACYASTTPFSANAVSGTYTASDSTNPPAQTIGGVAYNTGLLLGCPSTKGPPCVQSQTKNNAGDVLVTFLAPGDPYAHP